MTLTEFLLARIAEDEALLPEWFCGTRGEWRPFLRIKADCEAKRRIVALTSYDAYGFEDVQMALALPYADHPDYDEEWRP